MNCSHASTGGEKLRMLPQTNSQHSRPFPSPAGVIQDDGLAPETPGMMSALAVEFQRVDDVAASSTGPTVYA